MKNRDGLLITLPMSSYQNMLSAFHSYSQSKELTFRYFQLLHIVYVVFANLSTSAGLPLNVMQSLHRIKLN